MCCNTYQYKIFLLFLEEGGKTKSSYCVFLEYWFVILIIFIISFPFYLYLISEVTTYIKAMFFNLRNSLSLLLLPAIH